MACTTLECLRYLSYTITIVIGINWIAYLFYALLVEKHELAKYVVIGYWLASVASSFVNELTKSFYYLSLALLFALQSLVLSINHLELIGYLMVSYNLCLTSAKVIFEIIFLFYKTEAPQTSDFTLSPSSYVSIMDSINRTKKNRYEVIIIQFVSYFFTLAYFNYCTFRFWTDLYEIPEHAFRPKQLIFPINLLVITFLLLYMIELIIYHDNKYVIFLVILFIFCDAVFFFTQHYYNFAFLTIYIVILLIIYFYKKIVVD